MNLQKIKSAGGGFMSGVSRFFIFKGRPKFKIRNIYSLILLFAVAFAASFSFFKWQEYKNAPTFSEIEVKTEKVENQKVLTFKDDVSLDERLKYIESIGGEVVEIIDGLNTIVIKYDESKTQDSTFSNDKIATSEDDYFVSALGTVNDPDYDKQWGLSYINAEQIWEVTKDQDAKTVAVIDSGVCANHPDLAGQVLQGRDFVDNDANANDEFGHGCAVAGVIASGVNNGIGIAGVSNKVQILPIRVLDGSGYGTYSDVAAGIMFAADYGVDVINLSLGGTNSSSILENAVNYAVNKGVKVIAAAGNSGTEGALYPAKYSNVIAVGSLDQNGEISSFSNYGADVDYYAPGRAIYTLTKDGGYTYVNGTSFAAPMVSGSINNQKYLSEIFTYIDKIEEKEDILVNNSAITLYSPLVEIDKNLLNSILNNLTNNKDKINGISEFSVTNIREIDNWYEVIVVSKEITDKNWETELSDNKIFQMISRQNPDLSFDSYLVKSDEIESIKSQVPKNLIDLSTKVEASAVDYSFPWLGEREWETTRSNWHDTNSIDFRPGSSGSSAVLAAASGTVTSICGVGSSVNSSDRQTTLMIQHSEGSTKYLHLDSTTVDTSILGQYIEKGRFLGFLYQGAVTSSCGVSTGTHLHFEVPSRDLTFDGQNINTVATSPAYSDFLSKNTPPAGDPMSIIFYENTNYSGNAYAIIPERNRIQIFDLSLTSMDNKASSLRVGGKICSYLYALPEEDMVSPLDPNEVEESYWTSKWFWQWYGKNTNISDLGSQTWRNIQSDGGQPTSIPVNNDISTVVLGAQCYTGGQSIQSGLNSLSTTCFNGPSGSSGGGTQGDAGIFIEDVTIPDGTPIPPNTTFTKTWRMKNTGTTTWNTLYRLAFTSGNQMGSNSSVGLPRSVAPGQMVDISVTLTSPSTAGSYRGYWKLQNTSGVFFGTSVYVDINVSTNAPPPPSSGSVQLYSDRDYKGSVIATLGTGEHSNLTGVYYSMKLPSGWSAVTYLEPSFGGSNTRCWYQSEPNLQDHSWQYIRSMKIYNFNYCSGNERVKLYKLANYAEQTGPDYNLGSSDEPNKDSHSMYVPAGWSVRTFDQDGKNGGSRCWNTSIHNLGDHSWNLRIASIEVFPTDVCPSTASFVKLCKEKGAHEGSNCTQIDTNIASLGQWGFGNDAAKSIWMAGPWEAMLFEHDNYGGSRYKYRDSANDIANYPPNTADPNNPYGTSSIKVRRYDPAYVSLYRGGDYNDGGPFKTDRTLDNLADWDIDNMPQSIRVEAEYEIIVCEHAYFKGICGRWKGNDPNAYNIGKAIDIPGIGTYLQGRVSSLQVCKDQCGNPPVAATLFNPLQGSQIIPGTPFQFEWGGAGTEFMVEITGGPLTSAITSGWLSTNEWNAPNLAPSNNPYSWRIKSANEYGEGAWTNLAYFFIKDIPVSDVYIIGSNQIEPHNTLDLYGYINPADASNVTLSWSPAPLTGQGTIHATYKWTTTGTYPITLTATNSAGSKSKTYNIVVGCSVNRYNAEYYLNMDLSGNPVYSKCEDNIDYHWGSGGPDLALDGNLTVSAGQTYYTDNVRTHVAQDASLGQNQIVVGNTTGFIIGDEILIIKSQGTNTGVNEKHIVSAITGNTLTLSANLVNNFYPSVQKSQVIRIPRFKNVTVQNGGIITAHSWDGTTGGIIAFKAFGNVNIESGGKIEASGIGYRGGKTYKDENGPDDSATGQSGESPAGPNLNWINTFGNEGPSPAGSVNGSGGAGGGGRRGPDTGGGGGGGGYVVAGDNGQSWSGVGGGQGGFANSPISASRLYLGSGGGGGGRAKDRPNPENCDGGNGGGAIFVDAQVLTINGSIIAHGYNGKSTHNLCGTGGGGAGGTVNLKADTFNFNGTVGAAGGNGGSAISGGSQVAGSGGKGSAGKLYINYCSSINGSVPAGSETSQTTCGIDNFSVRWTGNIAFPADTYRFTAEHDDGARVWIDDVNIIDKWNSIGFDDSENVDLTSGTHEVKVEYYENLGSASMKLTYAPITNNDPVVSGIPDQLIGQNQTFSTFDLDDYGRDPDNNTITWSYTGNSALAVNVNSENVVTITTPQNWVGSENVTFTIKDRWGRSASDTANFKRVECAEGEYYAEYYANKDLAGSPVLTKCETDINKNWGTGSFDPSLNNKFGNGEDGDFLVASGFDYKTDSVRYAVTGTMNAGQTSVTIPSTNGINVGDEIFIIQVQGNVGDVGKYQFARVTAKNTTTLTLDTQLTNTYYHGGNARTQVIRVPNFNNLTVASGGKISASSWDGATGGIVVFKVKGNFIVEANASIDVKGRGFRAANYNWGGGGQPQLQGEGYTGYGTRTNSNNTVGGGGGLNESGDNGYNIKGAGGGGHATGGGNSATGYGRGGTTYGNANLLQTLTFGGAGGKGGDHWRISNGVPQYPTAMAGGGIINIQAQNITITGNVTAAGGDGFKWDDCNFCEGGGGAGGSIFIFGDSISAPGSVSAAGGTRFGSRDDASGNGGLGRVHVDYCSSKSGNFSPTPGTSNQIDCGFDNFSVRWTGVKNFTQGVYKFDYSSDDGIRAYLDEDQLVDGWTPTTHTGSEDRRVIGGAHLIKVEYFENTGSASINFAYTQYPNNPPVIQDIPDQTVNLGQSFAVFDLDDFATDNDLLEIFTGSYSGNTQIQVTIDSENIVSLAYPVGWIGEEVITFTVHDFTGATASDNATFKVIDPNIPPEITSTPITTVNEDSQYSYDVQATDADGNTLTYSLTTKPTGMSIDSASGLITWTPDNSHVGNHNIEVSVSDGRAAVSQEYVLTVNNTNDSPVVSQIPGQEIDEGQSFTSFDLDDYLTEVDLGDTITWSISGGGKLFTANRDANNVVTITYNSPGSGALIFRATDAAGAYSESVSMFTVININDAPTITITSPTSPGVVADNTFTITWIDSDPDNNANIKLFYDTNNTGNDGTLIVGNLTEDSDIAGDNYVWDTTNIPEGAYYIYGEITDNISPVITSYSTGTVTIDHKPVFTSTPITNIKAKSIYTYDANINNALSQSFSLLQAPTGMTINSLTGVVTWTPTRAQYGNHTVQINASDGRYNVSQNYTLAVDYPMYEKQDFNALDEGWTIQGPTKWTVTFDGRMVGVSTNTSNKPYNAYSSWISPDLNVNYQMRFRVSTNNADRPKVVLKLYDSSKVLIGDYKILNGGANGTVVMTEYNTGIFTIPTTFSGKQVRYAKLHVMMGDVYSSAAGNTATTRVDYAYLERL